MFEDFIDVLKVLVRHPSVVGAEHSFFRVLQRELEERGAKVTWYEGLLVAQGGHQGGHQGGTCSQPISIDRVSSAPAPTNFNMPPL